MNMPESPQALWSRFISKPFVWQEHISSWRKAEVLTVSCHFAGQNHADCTGRIYRGSIFGKPSDCECVCHLEAWE